MKNYSLHERFILQALLLKPELIHKVLSKISIDDFEDSTYRAIFQSIEALSKEGRPIELTTLVTLLANGDARAPISKAVINLAETAMTTETLDYHLSELQESRKQNILLETASQISRMVQDGESSVSVIEHLNNKLLNLLQEGALDEPIDIKSALISAVDTLGQPPSKLNRIMSGIPTLDAITGGFRPGELVIIGGSPGHGKSALGLQIALNAALNYQKAAIVFSCEMSNEDLALRSLAHAGHLDFGKLRGGNLQDLGQVVKAAEYISRAKVKLYDRGGLTISHLSAIAKAEALRHPFDLLVVDYLQLMSASGRRADRSREQEISTISHGLKSLAKELRVPILALSQLNREIDKRETKRPVLADLRESGAIEQDADMVIFVVRPSLYGDKRSPEDNYAEAIVAKHRNGPVGMIVLEWKGVYQTFREKTVG